MGLLIFLQKVHNSSTIERSIHSLTTVATIKQDKLKTYSAILHCQLSRIYSFWVGRYRRERRFLNKKKSAFILQLFDILFHHSHERVFRLEAEQLLDLGIVRSVVNGFAGHVGFDQGQSCDLSHPG